MAAVIGEIDPGLSSFNAMLSNPTRQHQHQHSHESSHYSADSRPRNPHVATQRPGRPDDSAPFHSSTGTAAITGEQSPVAPRSSTAGHHQTDGHVGGGASRIPSPPPSSSPSAVVNDSAAADDGKRMSATTRTRDPVPLSHPPRTDAPAAQVSPSRRQQPSPPSDDFPASSSSVPLRYSATPDSALTPTPSQPTVVHVRDLAHVQHLARTDMAKGSGSGMLGESPEERETKYEISAMPISDIIEMVAALLTKITTTNDLQHDAMSRNVTHQQQANQSNDSSGHSSMSPLSHSVLAFHGKNVPAITIHSYLARIHKYCPTTYEVFLSLLVYFDRMTERVNKLVARSEEVRRRAPAQSVPSSDAQSSQRPRQREPGMQSKSEPAAHSDESDSDLADDSDDEMGESPAPPSRGAGNKTITASEEQPTVNGPSTYFVVDSFNIHRLIIAGITCASKFFSDVFYTNSRYAKVGGLPLAELNHLEIQFLVLNEFRLAISVENLEAYATMLVEFYAREVVLQKSAPAGDE